MAPVRRMVKNKFDVMKYRHVWKDLEMADGFMDNDERHDIDLLIGNDYYDEVMKTEKNTGGGGSLFGEFNFGMDVFGKDEEPRK